MAVCTLAVGAGLTNVHEFDLTSVLLGGGPIDKPCVVGKQHRQTERNAVPGERREVVAGDIANQPAYARESR